MTWRWAQVLDPYGVLDDLSREEYCIGRAYFVRAPNNDIWVSTYDLPQATRQKFWQLLNAGYYKDDDSLPWDYSPSSGSVDQHF